MFKWRKYLALFIADLLAILVGHLANAEDHRPFSVADDIEFAQFGDVYYIKRDDVITSPAGDKIIVHTTRASLKDGKLHDELRVYDLATLRAYTNSSDLNEKVDPIWITEQSTTSTGDEAPLISNIQWMKDESGFAFLLRTELQNRRLCLAKLGTKDVQAISPEQDDVLSFSVRDDSHYVFVLVSHETREMEQSRAKAAFLVGTGKSLWDLMYPDRIVHQISRGDLWAANNGPATPIKDPSTGKPIDLYETGSRNLSLSPDGTKLVTVLALADVPDEWERLYPPPYPDDPYRIRAGHQDLTAPQGFGDVGEYVCITLASGKIRPLTNAPEATATGWWESSYATPKWSDDSSHIILPGSFLTESKADDRRPCLVVVELQSGATECVKPLKRNLGAGFEAGYEEIDDIAFARGRNDSLLLTHLDHLGQQGDDLRDYVRSSRNEWRLDARSLKNGNRPEFEVKVRATFKDPPALVGTDSRTRRSKVVFDPNPQLKQVLLGSPELYSWVDKGGMRWQGILYKPVNFQFGVKYPLVIQNHGFSADRFTPSGGFPSAFVAEELASAGIMVLHVRDCPGGSTPNEGPCNVHGYEAAVAQLSREGLIDATRVGIIGFSRTVYYVLETLTTSKLRFRAASISDGINLGYMDYLCSISSDNNYTREAEAVIGSRPIGPGFAQWLKNSPVFNLDKIATPLRVVATRSGSLLEMWEPYALLEKMGKPVDLIMLNTEEHIITNPAIRFAAQSGNIDWFRFWLQDYEDPDPTKADQYARWHTLRTRATSDCCVGSNVSRP